MASSTKGTSKSFITVTIQNVVLVKRHTHYQSTRVYKYQKTIHVICLPLLLSFHSHTTCSFAFFSFHHNILSPCLRLPMFLTEPSQSFWFQGTSFNPFPSTKAFTKMSTQAWKKLVSSAFSQEITLSPPTANQLPVRTKGNNMVWGLHSRWSRTSHSCPLLASCLELFVSLLEMREHSLHYFFLLPTGSTAPATNLHHYLKSWRWRRYVLQNCW